MPLKLEKSRKIPTHDWQDGDAIFRLREALKLSLRKFGDRLDVESTTVSRWEGGSRHPEKWMLIRMLLMCPRESPLESWFEARVGRTRGQVLAQILGEEVKAGIVFPLDIAESGSKIPSTPRPELPKEEGEDARPGAMTSDRRIISKTIKSRPKNR